jgi:Carboxypeptidase regulatory-like domain
MSSPRILLGSVIVIMGVVFATGRGLPSAAAPSLRVGSVNHSRNNARSVTADYASLRGKRPNGPLFTCTWTGSVNTDWSTAGNWSGCNSTVPQAGDTVTIGGAANQPTLAATAPGSGNLSSVTINSGGTLTVTGGGTLNTNADFALNGTLTISGGTVNVGTGAETSLLYSSGSALNVSGGALNVGGRLSPATTTPDTITYNQSNGTVTVAIFASSNGNFGAFNISATGSSFTMSGGTIILDEPSSGARDCRILASTSSVTGGTLQFGDASGTNTASGSSFGLDSTPVLFNLTVAHPNVDHLNIGSNVSVSNTLTLSGGNITSLQGATLTIGSAGSINRTNSSFVICALQKNGLSADFTFTVGRDDGVSQLNPVGYTPVSLTNVSGGGSLKVKTQAGTEPSVNAATSLNEYWTLTSSGTLTTDLTFTYLQGDVNGNESNYRLIRVSGGVPVSFQNDCPTPATGKACVDTTVNTALIKGVTSFSNWTVGENNPPTAAPAIISGQIADPDGRPLGGVTVFLSGNQIDRTITDANGQYRFDNVNTDAFYTVAPALVNYAFNPVSRSFSLVGNKTDAVFTAQPTGQIDNPLNGVDFFVRQQYLDFLGREPDHRGWLYWTDQISRCGNDDECLRERRLAVSAAFFTSDEFQQSANYIYRLYRAALGRQLTFAEFSADRQQVTGGPNLDASKSAFANAFVERAEFARKYQANTTAESFVDALLQTAASSGADLSSERDNLIASYNSGSGMIESRSLVVRALANNTAFSSAVYNPSFVLMEYFGYLRRDADRGGYDFWLNVLNNREAGNYRGMVCAFITATEYQRRFGSVITRSNADCAGVK